MSLVLMGLSFLICPMGTRLVSPAEGSYEEVMRSGVLVKAAFQHGGGVSRREVRLSPRDLGSPSCPSWASVFLFLRHGSGAENPQISFPLCIQVPVANCPYLIFSKIPMEEIRWASQEVQNGFLLLGLEGDEHRKF